MSSSVWLSPFRRIVGVLLAILSGALSLDASALARGDQFYHQTFNAAPHGNAADPERGSVFSSNGFEYYDSVPNGSALAGSLVRLSFWIKAQAVQGPGTPIKVLMIVSRPNGAVYYAPEGAFSSTFGWSQFSLVYTVPEDAQAVTLLYGLQNATGTMWLDDLRVEVIRPKYSASDAAPGLKYVPPRYRGVNANLALADRDADINGLRVWGTNLVRFQLEGVKQGILPVTGPAGTDKADYLAGYHAWLNSALQQLDKFLPKAHAAGMRVLVDLHSPPGGRSAIANADMIFLDADYQRALQEVWVLIATRYKLNSTVWGYDIVNEPVARGAASTYPIGAPASWLKGWNELASSVAQAIRVVDQAHDIIVESEDHGSADALNWMLPLRDGINRLIPGIVYSFHMYQPFRYTHQGLAGNAAPAALDPSFSEVNSSLTRVQSFADRMNVSIFVGEFSVIRSAPSGAAYLSHLVNRFETAGWGWSYHAYREFHGWSAEHNSDLNDHTNYGTSDRFLVLQSAMQSN